jgi:amidase
MVLDWENKADAKRQAVLDSIPRNGVLIKFPLPRNGKVTNGYIHQFLSNREIEITVTAIGGIAN